MFRLFVVSLVIVFASASLPAHETAPTVASWVAGGEFLYIVRAGETLRSVGARFGVEAAVLARENGLAVDAQLVAGRTLRLDNRHIVPMGSSTVVLTVNLPQRMLFYSAADGTVEAYPIAVGRRNWPTPIGVFAIRTLKTNPTWEVPESIRAESRRAGRELPARVPPGPNNPLGAHWIGLGGGIGIHGTNAPSSIFRAATHGCIRLHPQDVAGLFTRLVAGAPGRIIYESVLLAVAGHDVYFEVHRDIYGRQHESPLQLAWTQATTAGISHRIDWTAAAAVAVARDGVARKVTRTTARESLP